MAICPAGHRSGADDYCDVCGERIGAAQAPGGAAAPPNTAAAAAPPPGAAAGGVSCPDCGTPAGDRFCEECGYDFATGGGRPTPAAAPAPAAPPAAPAPAAPAPAAPPAPPPAVPAPQPPPPHVPEQPPPPPGRPPAPAPGPGGTAGQGGGWVAVVNADRDYYETMLADSEADASDIPFPPYCPERRIPLTGGQVRIGRRSSSQGSVPEIDLREPPEDPGVSRLHAVLLARPDGGWVLVDPGSANRTCLNGSGEPVPLNVEVPVGDGDRVHVGAWTTITLRRGEAR